jgi:Kelch motif protein
VSRGRASTHRRRRLTAVGALVVVIAVLVWLIAPGGSTSHPHRAAQATAHRSHKAPHASKTKTTTPAALSLTGVPVGRWVSLPDSPTSRAEVSAARLGDDTYVVGGFDTAGQSSSLVQRYDLRTGRWATVAPLPQPLNHMSAIGYAGRLYVVGGYASPGDTSTAAVRGFWRYDPATDRWQSMPDAPVARAAAGAAVIGHRLYVAGGRNDASSALSSLAIFDFDTGHWSLGPSLAHPREHVAAVAADGALWLLGGRALGLGSFTYVERYRPGAGAWESMPAMPAARSGFQAVAVGNGIVLVGGEDGTQMVPEVDRLDLGTDHWSRLADMTTPRHGLGVVADGPLIFSIDGGPQPGLVTSQAVQRLRVP